MITNFAAECSPCRPLRKKLWLLAVITAASFNSQSQQIPTAALNAPTDRKPYVEVSRGPHSRVMQRVTTWTNATGKILSHTNRYVELATGMSHKVGNRWVPSSDQIQLTADGAEVTNSQHKVHFASNLNSPGAIDLVTPEGHHMTSDIAGLVYFDGTTNVVIGVPKDSIGQVLPSLNKVLYTNAFSGVNADVLYKNSKGSFEQNIVLREQLPPPTAFGITASNVWLQVWTEFIDAPTPRVSEKRTSGDQFLDFGIMKMGKGKAFLTGDQRTSVPVTKQWFTSGGRTFLVESVFLNAIASQLQKLSSGTGSKGNSFSAPSQGGEQSKIHPRQPLLGLNAPYHQSSEQVNLPKRKMPAKSVATMQLAKSDPAGQGFVLDYQTMNTDVTDFTFQSDTTYYMSGWFSMSGVTTFEGGAVIKSDIIDSAGPTVGGTLQSKASPYRPIIFTSMNDDTVGETIENSTGAPQTGEDFISLVTCDAAPRYARFLYGFVGLQFYGEGGHSDVWDCQFLHCYEGIDDSTDQSLSGNGSISVHNTLFSDCYIAINEDGGVAMSVTGENLTVDGFSSIVGATYVTGENDTGGLTNCIFTRVNAVSAGGYGPSLKNCLVTNSADGIYQTVGAGNYYLAANSPYRNAGTTNVTQTLLSDLRQKTTYPPLWLTNSITNDTILNPQALRDTNSSLDLGYHYDPIDFLSFCMVSNATLTLTNGVALAFIDNPYAVWLENNGQLISQGTPNQHNYFAHYQLVQEQPTYLSTSYTNVALGREETMAINPYHDDPAQMPSAYLRFTTISTINGAGYVMYTSDGSWAFNTLTLRDCEIYCAGSQWSDWTSTSTPTQFFENNLFHRPDFSIGSSGQVTALNNLWVGAVADMYIYYDGSGSSSNTNFNNAFDGCADVYFDGTYSNNAYLNGTTVDGGVTIQSNDITTNLVWVAGPLGNYYQPTNSPLINKGSACATNFGLFHYTTTTNQLPETNSIVDIGYHYVALGTNGLPLSTSGDGIGDYLKDSNGDGIYDSGDLGNWLTNCSAGDGVNDYIKYIEGRNLNVAGFLNDSSGITGFQVFTPLK